MPSPIEILVTAAAAMMILAALGKVPLRYNYRNLTARWKTTLMTAAAFTLVIGLLTVMMAFVNGMSRLTESSGYPENVVVLADGATDELFSHITAAEIGDMANQRGIAMENGVRLASREMYTVVTQLLKNPPPGRLPRRYVQMRGLDDPNVAAAVHRIALFPGGRWFADSGIMPRSNPEMDGQPGKSAVEVVLGDGVARELALDRNEKQKAAAANPERLEPGDLFRLDQYEFLVVGVMQSAGLTFDSEIWAKRSVIAPLFGRTNYTSLIVRAEDAATAGRLKEFFTSGYKKAAVQAQVETDYYSSLSNTTKQFAYAVGLVTIVMAVGGVLGVMNTMFAAVSQRIRDIGVLRLLGFPRWQILISFMLESLMIALIGGLCGCAVGSLADGWSATSVVSSGPGGGKMVVLILTVDASMLAGGLILALAMGFIGGFVPAVVAMLKPPLASLR